MQLRQIGALAIALGAIAVLLSLFADTFGIGGNEETFGWKQVTLLVVGVVVAAAGVVALVRGGSEERRETTGPPSEPT
jgi:hypothetical protein